MVDIVVFWGEMKEDLVLCVEWCMLVCLRMPDLLYSFTPLTFLASSVLNAAEIPSMYYMRLLPLAIIGVL